MSSISTGLYNSILPILKNDLLRNETSSSGVRNRSAIKLSVKGAGGDGDRISKKTGLSALRSFHQAEGSFSFREIIPQARSLKPKMRVEVDKKKDYSDKRVDHSEKWNLT